MPINCAITQSDEQRNTQHPPFFFFVFFKYVMSSDFSDIFFLRKSLYNNIEE